MGVVCLLTDMVNKRIIVAVIWAWAMHNVILEVRVPLPLFMRYPKLQNELTYVPCVALPTPVHSLQIFGPVIGVSQLYVKRDDLTILHTDGGRQLFGGNKPRKLAFLLGDAKKRGAKSVLTFGAAGSNHAVATAACAQVCGLDCYLLLCPQPRSETVKRNITLMQYYGANIIWNWSRAERDSNMVRAYQLRKKEAGDYPYSISTGGSCALGAVGFVNAALELYEQVKNGVFPEPDVIYVAGGSGGTVAGLMVGLDAVEMKTRVRSVAVEPDGLQAQTVANLCNETVALLHSHDPTFSEKQYMIGDVDITYEHTGIGYGVGTVESGYAKQLLSATEGIAVDDTYAAKACAALVSDGQRGILKDQVVLFWNTFCANVPSVAVDLKRLPVEVRGYFAP